MTLKDARIAFTSMLPELINEAIELGYSPAIDMAKRCPDCKVGHETSLHKQGLAIDLLLYTHGGEYLTNTSDYEQLGEFWESIGGTWGGRFRDGNHFSLAYGGMK